MEKCRYNEMQSLQNHYTYMTVISISNPAAAKLFVSIFCQVKLELQTQTKNYTILAVYISAIMSEYTRPSMFRKMDIYILIPRNLTRS